MKFSTKTRYGIRTMLEIALQEEEATGVFQKDIAKNQNISVKYLDHIIQALKSAEIIANTRGKKSGYVLTRPASEITMLDIHNAFEGQICVVECLSEDKICEREEKCTSKEFWSGLNGTIVDYLKSVTLEDLKGKPENFNIAI